MYRYFFYKLIKYWIKPILFYILMLISKVKYFLCILFYFIYKSYRQNSKPMCFAESPRCTGPRRGLWLKMKGVARAPNSTAGVSSRGVKCSAFYLSCLYCAASEITYAMCIIFHMVYVYCRLYTHMEMIYLNN